MTHRLLRPAAAGLFLVGVLVPLAADDKQTTSARAFDDQQFVTAAASGGMHEVELGRLASAKAKNEAVKQFGKQMVDDHSKANEELKKAAKSAGLNVPTRMDDKHQKEFDRFKNYTGQNFDRDYVNHMVEDHQHDVAEFTRASKEAKNPAIKDFATKTLPTLQGHLEKVKKLQDQVK